MSTPPPNPLDDSLVYYEYDSPETPVMVDENGTTNVPLSADELLPGDTKRKRLIVRNNRTDGVLELIPFTEDPNLVIERYPATLGPQQSGVVEIKYMSPVTITEIPTLNFGFDLVLKQQQTIQ
jgi:hypothetical protein